MMILCTKNFDLHMMNGHICLSYFRTLVLSILSTKCNCR